MMFKYIVLHFNCQVFGTCIFWRTKCIRILNYALELLYVRMNHLENYLYLCMWPLSLHLDFLPLESRPHCGSISTLLLSLDILDIRCFGYCLIFHRSGQRTQHQCATDFFWTRLHNFPFSIWEHHLLICHIGQQNHVPRCEHYPLAPKKAVPDNL